MPPAGRAERLAAALLVAAVGASYANALATPFQFDDWNVIVGDSRVQSLASWWGSMPGIRPLLKLTYAANFELGGGVLGFHLLSLAIHLAAVFAAWGLLREVARRTEVEPKVAPWAAFGGAALFALHPVQTEAVTYLSGRSSALAGALALASLGLWLRGEASGKKLLSRALSPLLFAAALASKETTAVLPLALLLVAGLDRRRAWCWRRELLATSVHWLVLGSAAIVALSTSTYRALLETSLATRDVGVNLMTQARAVGYLAGQLVRVDRLNADPQLPMVTGLDLATAFAAAAVVTVAAVSCSLLRRRPAWAFGPLWFFLWLLPTNSLLPRLDVANDRQLYLAMLGPAWLAACAGARLIGARPRAQVALAVAVAIALGGATAARNRVYESEVAFWQDVVVKTPANARAFNNLGYALALEGRRTEAEAALSAAIRLDPLDYRAAVNRELLRDGAFDLGRDPQRPRR